MSSSSHTSRLHDRSGFTMVELIVGMLLSALVVGVLFQFLRGQSQFVAMTSARQEVVQNAQGALEIIGSDLRAVPTRGILAAEANGISVAIPRAWGITCDNGNGGAQTSVVFPASVPATAFTLPAGTQVGLMARGTAPASPWVPDRTVATLPSVTGVATIANPSAAGSPCEGVTPQATAGVTAVTFTGNGLPAGLPVASPILLYSLARYDAATVDGKHWARRSSGMPSLASPVMQPLAGPLVGEGDLRFEYFDAAGTRLTALPLSATDLDRVRRIKVVIATESTSPALRNRQDVQRDSIIISLRNQ